MYLRYRDSIGGILKYIYKWLYIWLYNMDMDIKINIYNRKHIENYI